jgi:PAS domain S-box-containing protein
MSESNVKIDYKSIFDKMLNGFALHKIVIENGKPDDYIFIDVNSAFEKMTGLQKDLIIGKKVSEVIPGIKNDPANWIDKYGQIALGANAIEFENYSEGLKKWFHISAYSPENSYFITIFDDITDRKVAELNLKAKQEETDRILKSVIDRELKMTELKEELKKLKGE